MCQIVWERAEIVNKARVSVFRDAWYMNSETHIWLRRCLWITSSAELDIYAFLFSNIVVKQLYRKIYVLRKLWVVADDKLWYWNISYHFQNRQTGQDTIDEVSRRDLRKELDERERAVARDKRGDRGNKGTCLSENVYFLI